MQLTGFTMPGYRVYEYLLVIQPHEILRNRIMQVRKEFNEKYRLEKLPIGKPNLALVNFLQYEMMEDRILNHLKTVAMGYHPFKVELKGFGNFPSHTIFINVSSRLPIQNLVKTVRQTTQRLMKLNDDNKPHFILEPHFTIAGKLKPWQFEKGWLEYAQKPFNARFIADGMLLLKRLEGQSKYQVVMRFDFQNLPVSTKQGELFG